MRRGLELKHKRTEKSSEREKESPFPRPIFYPPGGGCRVIGISESRQLLVYRDIAGITR